MTSTEYARPWAAIAATLAVALIACGGSVNKGGEPGSGESPDSGGGFIGTPTPDSGTGPTPVMDSGSPMVVDTGTPVSTTYPAPFPTPPQVTNSGGGVLSTPNVVAIFFSNDDMTSITTYTQFYNGLGATNYWSLLTEYGVGKSTTTVVTLTQPAPATIDDSFTQSGNSALQNWLLGVIGTEGIPANGPDVEYMINFPSTTTITTDGSSAGGGACDSFGGYHSSFQDNSGNNLAYGVLPRCPAVMGATVDQTFTSSASHEIIEAATDPYDNPAYLEVDDAHMFWTEVNNGSEIGDMCENDPEAYYQFSDFPFVIQRFWSNSSVKAGHDPCVPEITGLTFFAAVPEVTDKTIPFPDSFGNIVQAAGTKIAVGATATVTLDLYSDGPTSDWSIQAIDVTQLLGGGTPLLKLSLGQSTGNNGNKIPLTITVNAAGSETENSQGNGEYLDTEAYAILVSQGTGANQIQHFWLGLVGN
jgi:hypothetical protein